MDSVRLLALFIVFTHTLAQGQILEKDEIDEFTGHKIKKTSYEVLVQNFKLNAFVSANNINDSIYYLQLKLMTPTASVHAIDKDGIFFLKLSDNTVVELRNKEFTVSCTGCGARGFGGSRGQGTMTTYYLTGENLTKLKSQSIIKMRIYTTDGYLESNVNNARMNVIQDLLRLINN